MDICKVCYAYIWVENWSRICPDPWLSNIQYGVAKGNWTKFAKPNRNLFVSCQAKHWKKHRKCIIITRQLIHSKKVLFHGKFNNSSLKVFAHDRMIAIDTKPTQRHLSVSWHVSCAHVDSTFLVISYEMSNVPLIVLQWFVGISLSNISPLTTSGTFSTITRVGVCSVVAN